MLGKSEKGKNGKKKKKQSEIRLFTSTSNDPRFAPLLDPNGRPVGKYSSNIRGTLLVIFFGGKR